MFLMFKLQHKMVFDALGPSWYHLMPFGFRATFSPVLQHQVPVAQGVGDRSGSNRPPCPAWHCEHADPHFQELRVCLLEDGTGAAGQKPGRRFCSGGACGSPP